MSLGSPVRSVLVVLTSALLAVLAPSPGAEVDAPYSLTVDGGRIQGGPARGLDDAVGARPP